MADDVTVMNADEPSGWDGLGAILTTAKIEGYSIGKDGEIYTHARGSDPFGDGIYRRPSLDDLAANKTPYDSVIVQAVKAQIMENIMGNDDAGLHVKVGEQRTEANVRFAPGDVVRLKSGGPAMTVKEVSGNTASTEWFDADGDHHHMPHFRLGSLVKVDAEAERAKDMLTGNPSLASSLTPDQLCAVLGFPKPTA